MSTKKTKYMSGKPFTVEVCDAIRHHIGARQALDSKRKNAFEDRDAALSELAELKDKHSPDALKVKERHSDAVCAIDDLTTRIKWHSGQVDKLVEKADEPEFEFMYEISDLEKKEAEDDRPVGKPGTPKPRKGRGAQEPEAAQPEGFNQHLAASINELDCNDAAKQKLVDAGFVTIGQLNTFINSGKDLRGKLNVGENTFSAINRAFKKYLKDHVKADQEATKDGRWGVA